AHTCVSCANVGDCTTAYGNGYVCQTATGKCLLGTCNTNGDCPGVGQICNSSAQCVSCGTDDTLCTGAYGAGYICVSGNCVTGTCHTGAQCTGAQSGQVCSVSTHTCGACTADAPGDLACQTSYTASYLCAGTTCVVGNCRTNG